MDRSTNQTKLPPMGIIITSLVIALLLVLAVWKLFFTPSGRRLSTELFKTESPRLPDSTNIKIAGGSYQISPSYQADIYQQAFRAGWQELQDREMVTFFGGNLVEIRYRDSQTDKVETAIIDISKPVVIVLEDQGKLGDKPVMVNLSSQDQTLYLHIAQSSLVAEPQLTSALGQAFDMIASRGETYEGPTPIIKSVLDVLGKNRAVILAE